MKRILHWNEGFAPAIGGTEQRVLGLAEAQVRAGHRVRVIAESLPNCPDEEVFEGIRMLETTGGFGSLGGQDFIEGYTRGGKIWLRLECMPDAVCERRQRLTNFGRTDREAQHRANRVSLHGRLSRQRAAANNPPRSNPA